MTVRFYDDILEVAGKKIAKLKEKVLRLQSQALQENVKERWVAVDAWSGIEEAFKVSGIDGGSYISLSTLAYDLYIVKAYAITMSKSRGWYSLDREEGILDIDLVIPPLNSSDRVNIYRDVGEVKCMIRGAKASDLVLADGSIESLLTRPTHLKLGILDSMLSKFGTLAFAEALALDEREFFDTLLASKSVIESEFLESSEGRDFEELARRVVALELAEKALAVKTLFETLLVENKKVVFITKTGRSNKIFGRIVPDQYILTEYTRKPGFLVEDKVKRASSLSVPSFAGLKDLSRKIAIVSGYARFVSGGPVLRVEVVTPFSVLESKDPKEVFLGTLHQIHQTCTGGYPHPLLIAHQRAHIEKRAADIIVEALGLKSETTGRESVELA
uniref:DNA double-strand break repair nuclease NurA n=1 Tax=Fervidicoccus fontis TaxID=683846 RepID=A0A7J3ZL74_9CREN